LTLRDNDDGRDAQEKNKGPGPTGLVRRLPPTAVRAIPGLRGQRPGFAPISCVRTPDGRLVAFRAVTGGLRPVETAGIDVPHRTGKERSWRSGLCTPSSRVQPGPKSASNLARWPPPVSSHWRTENRTHLVFHVHGIRPSTSTAQAEFQGGGRKLTPSRGGSCARGKSAISCPISRPMTINLVGGSHAEYTAGYPNLARLRVRPKPASRRCARFRPTGTTAAGAVSPRAGRCLLVCPVSNHGGILCRLY
jgi:hypothetical protein